jgi:DNA-binding SARP family transcriptional activator
VRSSFASAEVALDQYLTIDAEVIGLSSCARVDLDVARFEAALRGSTAAPEEAIALYHGDLVECLGLECFAVEAERLSDAYEDALALVAERRLGAGDPIGARDVAELLLARDPLREEAHVTLLRVYGQLGSRAQVMRQYRRLTELLADELSVEPLPETVAAYHAALAETVERSQARATELAFGAGPAGPGRRIRSGGLAPSAAHR